MQPPLLQQQVSELLSNIATGRVTGAGGCSAALTSALAAALIELVARTSSPGWNQAGSALAQAEVLQRRLGTLAHEEAAAYEAATNLLAATSGPRSPSDPDAERSHRDQQLADALREAAAVPLAIAETAADVAALAAWTASAAGDAGRADAQVAACLAEAAAAAAAGLVTVNLTVRSDDAFSARASAAAAAARRSRSDAHQLT